jgi:hypothetical protein
MANLWRIFARYALSARFGSRKTPRLVNIPFGFQWLENMTGPTPRHGCKSAASRKNHVSRLIPAQFGCQNWTCTGWAPDRHAGRQKEEHR